MRFITPPQRDYLTPEIEILSVAIEGSFTASGGGTINDHENNTIIDELEDGE